MKKQVEHIFYALMICAVLSSLVFYSGFYLPFQTTKVLFFVTLINITLPFYIYLLFEKPELRSVYKNKITITLLLFLLAMIVSAIFGVDPINSFNGNTFRRTGVVLYLHMGLFSIYITSLFLLSKSWGEKLLKLLVIIGALEGLHGLLEFMRIIPSFYGTDRTAGLFGNPIFFASFLFIPMFLALYFAQKSKQKIQLAYYTASGVMLLGILSTGTRGALLGIIAGTLTLLSLHTLSKTKKTKQIILTAITSIIGLVLIFFLAKTLLPKDNFIIRLTDFTGKNASSRLNYWKIGIKGWKDAPILGVGTENYYTVADKYFTREMYTIAESWPDKPHNQFVEFLSTLGIIGFGLYITLLFLLVKLLFTNKKNKPNQLLIAALVAYIIQNMFVFDTISAMLTFYLLIGFVSSFNKDNIEQNQNTNKTIRNISIALSILIALLLITNLHFPNTKKDVGALADDYKKEYDQALNSGKSTQTEINTLFERSINQYEQALEKHPIRTRYWYGLSRVYLLKSTAEGTPINQKGIDATKKTIELAPNRIEARLSEIFILKQNGDKTGALKLAEKIHASAPSDAEAAWVLAGLYYESNRIDEATRLGLIALKNNIILKRKDSLNWLVEYLIKQNDYENVVVVYEKIIEIEPDNLALFPNLATAYALSGQKEKAIETANLLLEKDPTSKPMVEAFIKSLN